MILYFEHTQHTIKISHKFIKQDYKIWALEKLDYILLVADAVSSKADYMWMLHLRAWFHS